MRGIALFAACAGLLAGADTFSVFRSEDGGRSWVRSGSGLPRAARVNAFETAGRSTVAATDAGVFRSADQGRNWQAANGPGRSLALAAQGKALFAGTSGQGIWISTDEGQAWRRLTGFDRLNVRSIVSDGARLYAGGNEGGVFLSTDDGQTWSSLSGGLPSAAQVFSLAIVKGRLFAGLYAKGLYSWDGQWRRWAKAGDVTPLVLASSGDSLVIGHNPGGLLWSANLSDFARADMGSLAAEAPVWALVSGRTQVYAGAAAGIYYSDNRGRSWTHAQQGLPDKSPGIAFLVTDRFVIAAIAP